MPIYKSNLYEQLIIDLKPIVRNVSIEDYLFDLRPVASNLYKNLASPSVNIDYSDHVVQIAYMLRYLPGYWEQIYTSLLEIHNQSKWPKSKIDQEMNPPEDDPLQNSINKKEDFNIALFCCGPAPEIIGIVKFFEEIDYIRDLYQNINIHLFDLKVDSWKFARDIFVLNENAMEKLSSQNFHFFEHQLDVTDQNLNLDLKFGKQVFHICHFQNCLNEIYHTTSKGLLIKNIYSISKLLIDSGFLIMTDRNTISSSREVCNFIAESLASNSYFEAAQLITGSYFYDTHSPITDIDIMRNLFWQSPDYKGNSDQRLIPTSKNQRFIQLLRKNLN